MTVSRIESPHPHSECFGAPVPGHNIVLTLDAHLQRTAEEAFLEHIQTLDDNQVRRQVQFWS